jgi:hypothetical protein
MNLVARLIMQLETTNTPDKDDLATVRATHSTARDEQSVRPTCDLPPSCSIIPDSAHETLANRSRESESVSHHFGPGLAKRLPYSCAEVRNDGVDDGRAEESGAAEPSELLHQHQQGLIWGCPGLYKVSLITSIKQYRFHLIILIRKDYQALLHTLLVSERLRENYYDFHPF